MLKMTDYDSDSDARSTGSSGASDIERAEHSDEQDEYEHAGIVLLDDRHLWGGFNLGYNTVVIVPHVHIATGSYIQLQFKTEYGTSPHVPSTVLATHNYRNMATALTREAHDRVYPPYYGHCLRKRHVTSIAGPVTALHLRNNNNTKPIKWDLSALEKVDEKPVFRYRVHSKK